MHHLKIILITSIGMAMAFSNAHAENGIIPPLEQIKSGIMIQDIKCKENFVLVIKESNSNPACIKPTNTVRLLSHGWITLATFETNHPITQQKNTLALPQENSMSSNPQNVTNTGMLNQQQNNTNQIANNMSLSESKNAIMPSSQINNATQVTNGSGNNNDQLTRLYSKNFPSHLSFGNGLIWVNDVYDPNSPLYTPSMKPLPEVTSTPTVISSSMPGVIKILSVGMYPNPLKVGDKPQFTITYQNISDKKISHFEERGCCLWFGYMIGPPNNIQENYLPIDQRSGLGDSVGEMMRNQITTDPGCGAVTEDLSKNGRCAPSSDYKIIKPGMLTVTMKLALSVNAAWDLVDTIQFNVNATQ